MTNNTNTSENTSAGAAVVTGFSDQFDSNPYLIGFENGVYDLKSGEFRDGRPEDYISLSTGNNYVEFNENDEKIVAIYTFLSQIFPDEELRKYVLLLLASFLAGTQPNDNFYIWSGVGGNGKSKLLELFEAAFGQYIGRVPVTLFTQKRSNSNAELAQLRGLRFVSTQEPDENERFNVGQMKDITGGNKITCRQITFKPMFKIAFLCNQLPALSSDDEGTWRRIRVIDFISRFTDHPDPNNKYEFQRDRDLSEKISSWKEAFMFILLEHYKIYQKCGLVEPHK